jgi:hypothetical protein
MEYFILINMEYFIRNLRIKTLEVFSEFVPNTATANLALSRFAETHPFVCGPAKAEQRFLWLVRSDQILFRLMRSRLTASTSMGR